MLPPPEPQPSPSAGHKQVALWPRLGCYSKGSWALCSSPGHCAGDEGGWARVLWGGDCGTWGWEAFPSEPIRSFCISGGPSLWGAVLGLEPRLETHRDALLAVARRTQCMHKHPQRSPFPSHRSLDAAPLPAWTREIPAKSSLETCVLQVNPCGWVSESCVLPWLLPASSACKRRKTGLVPDTCRLPSRTRPVLRGTLPGKSQPPGHADRV